MVYLRLFKANTPSSSKLSFLFGQKMCLAHVGHKPWIRGEPPPDANYAGQSKDAPPGHKLGRMLEAVGSRGLGEDPKETAAKSESWAKTFGPAALTEMEMIAGLWGDLESWRSGDLKIFERAGQLGSAPRT